MYSQVPDTFRSSSTKIKIGDKFLDVRFGGNAQNKSKDIRYLFIPDKDKKLFQIDQYGAEALAVAYDCNPNSKFRQLFIHGIKPHTYCAANLFSDIYEKTGHPYVNEILSLPIKDIKLHPGWKLLSKAIKDSDNEPMRYYYLGKKTIHAGNYGEQENTMSVSIVEETDGEVNISPSKCAIFLRKHHATFPEIKRDFQTGVVQEASNNGAMVRNFFGYPRLFTGYWGEDTFRKMYAFRPQSTIGCITHLAITEIQNDIDDNKIPKEWELDILQNGHDSIFGQFNDDINIEKEVCKYIKPHIERELVNRSNEHFNMKSEMSTGYNWMPAKEPPDDVDINNIDIIKKYNLRGLKEINY